MAWGQAGAASCRARTSRASVVGSSRVAQTWIRAWSPPGPRSAKSTSSPAAVAGVEALRFGEAAAGQVAGQGIAQPRGLGFGEAIGGLVGFDAGVPQSFSRLVLPLTAGSQTSLQRRQQSGLGVDDILLDHVAELAVH